MTDGAMFSSLDNALIKRLTRPPKNLAAEVCSHNDLNESMGDLALICLHPTGRRAVLPLYDGGRAGRRRRHGHILQLDAVSARVAVSQSSRTSVLTLSVRCCECAAGPWCASGCLAALAWDSSPLSWPDGVSGATNSRSSLCSRKAPSSPKAHFVHALNAHKDGTCCIVAL